MEGEIAVVSDLPARCDLTNINPRDVRGFIGDVEGWLRALPTSELYIAFERNLILRFPQLKDCVRPGTRAAESVEEYIEAQRRWVAAFQDFVAKVAQGPTDHSTCLLCEKPLTENSLYCAEHAPKPEANAA